LISSLAEHYNNTTVSNKRKQSMYFSSLNYDDLTRYFKSKSFFRPIFGLYLCWHFCELIPYAEEVFGLTGMISNPELGPTYSFFPNAFNFVDPKFFVTFMFTASVLFLGKINQQMNAAVMWYGWSCMLNRNVFINNPGMAYVGFLLIIIALGFDDKKHPYYKHTYFISWFLMCLGYTVSGLHKLQSPSWIDGSALYNVLTSPIARDNSFVDLLVASPEIVLKSHTWPSLVLEMSCLFLGCFYHMRKFYWFALFGLHLGILATINFTDLTLGVLMIQVFLFDPQFFSTIDLTELWELFGYETK
jgi:hypothetical protein